MQQDCKPEKRDREDEKMPKGSPELTSARREEIITACRKLYETKSFKEITLKEIGQLTSFTRTSIYNYFETKEEIFLALFQQEYELLAEDLDGLCERYERLSQTELASELARSLERRPLMLKLLSMNLYDMEANSRMERLVEFKTAYGESTAAINRCLQKFVPDLDDHGIPADTAHRGDQRRHRGVHRAPGDRGLPLCGEARGDLHP